MLWRSENRECDSASKSDILNAWFVRSLAGIRIIPTSMTIARVISVVFLLAIWVVPASSQSTDIAWPSPIRSNEARGTIPARDLGDARVTDHFYAFTGLPGDVLITVDTQNLNGDIDVFTMAGLRPLIKFTVYADNSSPITKGIYLRREEMLILRVEGRTPNDDPAIYRLHLGGTFASIKSGPLAEHEDALGASTAAETANSGGRRVSSVGARIDEPRTEVAETPKPAPTPLAPTTVPKAVVSKPAARSTRARVPVARRTRPARTPKPKPAETPASDESAANENKPAVEESEPAKPATPVRPSRRGKTARAPKPPPAQEPEEGGPRLVIETVDGTLVDRSMAGVRRVTVENGQVVVIGKDGKIQRVPLASVVRMTIAP